MESIGRFRPCHPCFQRATYRGLYLRRVSTFLFKPRAHRHPGFVSNGRLLPRFLLMHCVTLRISPDHATQCHQDYPVPIPQVRDHSTSEAALPYLSSSAQKDNRRSTPGGNQTASPLALLPVRCTTYVPSPAASDSYITPSLNTATTAVHYS